jgi:16S rRNA U1498 N3-methylase RsmE
LTFQQHVRYWSTDSCHTCRSQPPGSGDAGGGTRGKSKYSKKQQAAGSADDGSSSSSGGGGEDDYQPGRLERVAIAATKQCLRAHMLKLHAPTYVLDPAFQERLKGAGVSLIAAAGGAPLHQVLQEVQAELAAQVQGPESQQHTGQAASQGFAGTGILLVGPQGDWTPEELKALSAAGARPVGLGALRLRTETAAIALLSAVQMSSLSKSAL